jgi:hypothetical protein
VDSQLLRRLYLFLFADPKLTRTRHCVYSDAVVLLVFGFALIHDLSPRAALRRDRWPLWCRKIAFPGYSQLMKRLNRLDDHVEGLRRRLRYPLPATSDKLIDGKPLTISGFTHDPDAKNGHVPGGFACGYKVHVVADAAGPIEDLAVTPMNVSESDVAQQLVAANDLRHAVVRADANYDDHDLYTAAASAGARLIAPRRKPGTGVAKRSRHPHRLRAIAELEQTPGGLQRFKRKRNRIEQILAHLGNLSFGLSRLPNHVRRLRRVRRWANGKVLLYHLHLLHQDR